MQWSRSSKVLCSQAESNTTECASLARFSRLNLAAMLDSWLTLSVDVCDRTTTFNLLDFLKRSVIEAIPSQYTGIALGPST